MEKVFTYQRELAQLAMVVGQFLDKNLHSRS